MSMQKIKNAVKAAIDYAASISLRIYLPLVAAIVFALSLLGFAPATAAVTYVVYLYNTYKLQVYVTFGSYAMIRLFDTALPAMFRMLGGKKSAQA